MLMDGAIGRRQAQLERVNPSPFPTHSAQESKWAKAEVTFLATSGYCRGSHLLEVSFSRESLPPL